MHRIEEEERDHESGHTWEFRPPTPEELYHSSIRAWLDRQPRVLLDEPAYIATQIAKALVHRFRCDSRTALSALKAWNRETDIQLPDREIKLILDNEVHNLELDEKGFEHIREDYQICPQANDTRSQPIALTPPLIESILAHGRAAMWGAAYKSMKTTIAIDAEVSLATGTSFLGRFPVPTRQRVLSFMGEIDRPEFTSKVRACCEARQIDPDSVWPWVADSYSLPKLATKRGHEELKYLIRDTQAKVVFLDPTYKLFGVKGGMNAANLYTMGSLFSRAAQTCLEQGATPVFIHHAGRDLRPGVPMELGDFLFAGAAEFCRQWLLINRAVSYDPSKPGKHSLIASFGSSSYPGGIANIGIDEGEVQPDGSGRKWHVEVSDYEADQEQAAKAKGKSKRKREASGKRGRPGKGDKTPAVLELLAKLGGSEQEVKRSALKPAVGGDSKALTSILRQLEKEGKIAVREEPKLGGDGTFKILWVRLV
jgi:hypothetical protein